MTGDALVADGLRKRYGDIEALGGVTLTVPAGEVFALVGPNGAGKTTLVRCLTGTLDPSGGSATLLGGPPGEVDRDRLGLLPQEFSPPDRLTARELLEYYAGLYATARDVDDVLADVGMADAAGTRYANLSGGQKRRTLVGTAIVNDPDVLFLDEPTTGIDPAGRRRLWDLIDDLAAGGTTVFLTSHSMAEVERLADRVALLADGRIVALDDPASLIAAHGGASRVVVSVDDAERTAAAVADAAETAGFDAEATLRGLVFGGIEAEAIGDVVDFLVARDVGYDSLAWRQPGLEDVYLELTGESFAGESGRVRGEGARSPGEGAPGSVAAGGADGADGGGERR